MSSLIRRRASLVDPDPLALGESRADAFKLTEALAVEVNVLVAADERENPSLKLIPIGSVVVEVRRAHPDVTHSSLRFLEREGLIHATRTPGGHRLYKADDVERIRRIKTWQLQRLSLDEIRRRLDDLNNLDAAERISTRFLDKALNGNLGEASREILHADDVGMALNRLMTEIVCPALREVGDLWAAGTITVAQEKEVTELVKDLISELSYRHTLLDPQGPIVVAACVAGELHDLGLRMVSMLLRARGWRLHFLGADVAPQFLAEAVRMRDPSVVLLSITTEQRLPAVEEAIAALFGVGAIGRPQVVVVGGPVIAVHCDTLREWGAIPAVDHGFDSVFDALEVAISAHTSPRQPGSPAASMKPLPHSPLPERQ